MVQVRRLDVAAQQKFSLPHENCFQTRRCAKWGHQCYKKDKDWAGCRASCTPGIYELDQPPHRTPWSCELISHRSLPHENCLQTSGLCAEPGHRCFRKNEHWAGCRARCTPGIYEHDEPPHRTPWSCEPINLPEKRIAVKSDPMKGLCLSWVGESGAPVTYEPCGRAQPWITRTSHGDFDLWQEYGSIRPARCPQGATAFSIANGEFGCKNGWGLRWRRFQSGSQIELMKDGKGYGLCLGRANSSPGSQVGSKAVWAPCARYGESFEEVGV